MNQRLKSILLITFSTMLLTACTPKPPTPGPDQTTVPAPVPETAIPTDENSDVRVTFPRPNEIVTSPLVITGEAKGTWFFEASMPIELQDAEGNTITEGPVQAIGDWMTEDFVPFRGTLEFEEADSETGKLIIHKANASGLPENDDSVEILVRF